MKKTGLLFVGLAAVLTLAGCGTKLSTSKTTYSNSGMVAIVKGDATGKAVSYTAATKAGKTTVNDGKFTFTVPMSTKQQDVTIKDGNKTVSVTVKAAKSLGEYKKIAAKYNQAIVATALPASVQKQLRAAATQKQPTKQEIAALPAAEQQKLVAQQQALQAAMKTASAKTKDQQLPGSVAGLKEALAAEGGKLRVNVQDGQLISATQIAPIKTIKDKRKQAEFGQMFGLLANAVGADAKKVGKDFQQALKDQDGRNTTIKTIKSNGVRFNVGASADDLFIYVTK
ncbi:hypothetical protein ACFQ3L_00620 [Lacticaseibacillus jixianensis]|uniref:Lipoprotein n=1 Tax=Lacticaseibacillus jixianensis TaxID=2486012 RepID=A0ABW4B7T6_9LACO|nr:hypothetical protein [Lacticaseibacillus jixianensis]